MAWVDNWDRAAPIYRRAENAFAKTHRAAKALYAQVSQIPSTSGTSEISGLILGLTKDLTKPEAQDPEVRLRILTIRGMVETNYDAAMARSTWAMVQDLAERQHRFQLASRASGEQGIAAFLLGDVASAKKQVLRAWSVAKVLGDQAAIVRYASVYGAGLVQFHKFNEALGPLDEAIKLAKDTPAMAYPSIAVNYKITALSGLGRYQEALALSEEALRYPLEHHLLGMLYSLLETRGEVYERQGKWTLAIESYREGLGYARTISYWRGLAEGGGALAAAYEHEEQLHEALASVNEAIAANQQVSDELYFVPRNLALKAGILAKLGRVAASNTLYQKSADLIDSLLTMVPTAEVERGLLADLSYVYSRYFTSLCDQKRVGDAFQVIEKARGRIESQSLQHHDAIVPHSPTAAEKRLVELNIRLINAEDAEARTELLRAIGNAEHQMDPDSFVGKTALHPVSLGELQRELRPYEVVVEYVLDEPSSYALAITGTSARRYVLAGKNLIEGQTTEYRGIIRKRKEDLKLAHLLFDELLAGIPEYKEASTLIVVPDGQLHLLPFVALADGSGYVVASHAVCAVESGTVLQILKRRHIETTIERQELPYVGVAAWTKTTDDRNIILRAVTGPQRSQLIALPESRREVEEIGKDLPKPSTLLLGGGATESHFKELPLSEFKVLHLALHGYADNNYPERSALVFAPEEGNRDDGLLQLPEIRHLNLNASLVTLSACNTGVGPVGESGVSNVAGAFVEAGAESVVSTLWELEDHSTSRLMQMFYRHLARHEEKAEALRAAQMSFAGGYSPYYWASFELVGNPSGTIVADAQPQQETASK